MQYIANKSGDMATAKEIADSLNISFDFLAKTLQTLMKKGLIKSTQGIKGGYILAQSPDEINISTIIFALENNVSI